MALLAKETVNETSNSIHFLFGSIFSRVSSYIGRFFRKHMLTSTYVEKERSIALYKARETFYSALFYFSLDVIFSVTIYWGMFMLIGDVK